MSFLAQFFTYIYLNQNDNNMSIRFALHILCAFFIGAIPNAVWGLNFWNWQWWAIITPSLIILNMFFKQPKR